jgi:hypothetical protein
MPLLLSWISSSSGAISAKRLECRGGDSDEAPPDGELDIGERVLGEFDIGELVIGGGEPDIGEEWPVGRGAARSTHVGGLAYGGEDGQQHLLGARRRGKKVPSAAGRSTC